MNKTFFVQLSPTSDHSVFLKSKKRKLPLQPVSLNLYILLLFAFLAPQMVSADDNPREKRIMLQLRQEVKSNDCHPFCKNNMIGNSAIDDIHKQVQVNKIKKITAGQATGKYIYVVELAKNENIEEVITRYEKTGQIIHAEPDHLGFAGGKQFYSQASAVPDDAFFNRQWSLQNDGSFTLSPATEGSDIDMPAAWEIETGDTDLIIAILDSGVNTNEPDINERLWKNPGEQVDGETINNEVDEDENGYIDDHIGWDFANNDNGVADGSGHGSNIAGIIGAQANNEIGYTGINWHSKLMNLKALDDELNGWYSWWIDAIYYAVDNGAHIINMSMGGDTHSAFFQEAVDYALENNVPVVACMMNEDNDVTYYPAAFQGVIAVGSTNPDDTRSSPFFWSSSSGSNYGDHISIIAPGNYIYSISNYPSNYNIYWGGTSMAAPHVTAVASLLMSQNPSLTPDEIKEILEMSAEDQVGDPTEDVEGWDPYYGHGRLNAYNALSLTITSVDEQNKTLPEVRIFPNPANEFLHIATSEPNSRIQILDLKGKVISMQEITSLQGSLDVRDFKPGVYLIRVYSENQFTTKKWIKSP
ncbi:MAG: S8 family serine peptidase [Bacteroidales bacterium]